MSDPKLRQKLLEEKNIKLKDALEKARQRELATVQARSMDSSSESSIHQQRSSSRHQASSSGRRRQAGTGPRGGGSTQSTASKNADSKCFSYGQKGDYSRSPECPARGKKCSNCEIVGHFAVVCWSQKKKDKGGQSQQCRVHDLPADAEQQDECKQSSSDQGSNSYSCEMYNVGRVGSSTNRPVFVDLEINGEHLLMELDTGAEHTVIPRSCGKLSGRMCRCVNRIFVCVHLVELTYLFLVKHVLR